MPSPPLHVSPATIKVDDQILLARYEEPVPVAEGSEAELISLVESKQSTKHSAVSLVYSEYITTTLNSTANTSRILRDRVSVPSRNNSGRSSAVIEELERETPEELILLKEKFTSLYSSFSYSELAKITSDFTPECVVGQGGRELTVKILKYSDKVKKGDRSIFGWAERFNVAVGVANALDYLHGKDNSRPVIHRDVKSLNILISQCFEPKLSDFGLAVWAADVTSQMACNDIAGTFGYLAPVNNKIDVYAFGVVLLELISGRKPLCTGCPKGQESLVIWANSIIHGGKLTQLVGPNLPIEGHTAEVEKMTLAASLCIRQAHQNRPQIDAVLKLLQGDDEVLKWARSEAGLACDSNANECVMTPPAPGSNTNIQSYINLAFYVEDYAAPVSSNGFITANTSLEEYLRGRWSRSSSFD